MMFTGDQKFSRQEYLQTKRIKATKIEDSNTSFFSSILNIEDEVCVTKINQRFSEENKTGMTAFPFQIQTYLINRPFRHFVHELS
jgi:hypothetical protein